MKDAAVKQKLGASGHIEDPDQNESSTTINTCANKLDDIIPELEDIDMEEYRYE